MKNKIMLIYLLASVIYGQQWHSYYNRFPVWPQTVSVSTANSFAEALNSLGEEIKSSTPEMTEGIGDFENMSQEEAMKLAMEFQKNAMNMNPDEIKRRSEMIDSYVNQGMSKEMQMDAKLERIKEEFDNKIYDGITKIHEEYPCDIGIESGSDKCDERSKALKKLSAELSAEYFLGSSAKFRGAADDMIDYMIKKKLPESVKQEKDQNKMMGVEVSGEHSAFKMLYSCIEIMQKAADRIIWLGYLADDENWHYYPGQTY